MMNQRSWFTSCGVNCQWQFKQREEVCDQGENLARRSRARVRDRSSKASKGKVSIIAALTYAIAYANHQGSCALKLSTGHLCRTANSPTQQSYN